MESLESFKFLDVRKTSQAVILQFETRNHELVMELVGLDLFNSVLA
jgi:hypothetical protein